MASPKHREYTRFYNRTFDNANTQQGGGSASACASPRSPSGFTVQRRWDPYQDSVRFGAKVGVDCDKSHHRKQGDGIVGVTAADTQRKHLFPQLPGQTFNDQTWKRFTSRADQTHQLLSLTQRSQSTPRCTCQGSPTARLTLREGRP